MSKVTHLRELLEVSGAQLENGVNLAERDKPARRLTGFVFSQAAEEINKALSTVNVPEVLAHGWARSRALRSAAASTRETGKPEVVTLGEHDFKYSCNPVVELHAADAPLPEIRLTVELTARFKNVELSVADGKLTAISPGAASVNARLKYGTATLVEKITPNARVPSNIKLQPPLEIG
jgi:hypothetical protein